MTIRTQARRYPIRFHATDQTLREQGGSCFTTGENGRPLCIRFHTDCLACP